MIGDVVPCMLIQIFIYLNFCRAELQCHMLRIAPRCFADNVMKKCESNERVAYGFRDRVQLRGMFAARDMSLKKRSDTNIFLIHPSE